MGERQETSWHPPSGHSARQEPQLRQLGCMLLLVSPICGATPSEGFSQMTKAAEADVSTTYACNASTVILASLGSCHVAYSSFLSLLHSIVPVCIQVLVMEEMRWNAMEETWWKIWNTVIVGLGGDCLPCICLWHAFISLCHTFLPISDSKQLLEYCRFLLCSPITALFVMGPRLPNKLPW